MDVRIVAVGKMRDKRLASLVEDYAARIRHEGKLDITEIKDGTPESEQSRLLQVMSKAANTFICVLSEDGVQLSSEKLSLRLAEINRPLMFVIGGPFGLSTELKNSAHMVLSLSAMTFTHEMARVLLLEQIYRALSILHKRKYHKA